jgi:hypothetical protein
MRLLRALGACGLSMMLVGSAAAVELRPLMKRLGPLGRVEIGKEIHFTDGEVRDGTALAGLATSVFPKAAPFIGAAIGRIQRENKGNGVVVEVIWTGQVVGTRPR